MRARMAVLILLPLLLACPEEGPGGAARAGDPAPIATPTHPIRILALGDSYTIGEGVRPEERWPVELGRLLRAEGFKAEDPRIVARTGWTSDELLAAVDQARLQGPFELVTLLVGVNDQYRRRAPESLREPLRKLLERAVALADGKPARVVVVSIPDWGATAFARSEDRPRIAAAIDAFNEVAKEEAGKAGAGWADVTGLSRAAGVKADYSAKDELHPSGKAYEEWARQAILPAARSAILEGQ